MNNILAQRKPHITLYSCERGGIHLVHRHINVGMTPAEFCQLNRHVQDVADIIADGEWSSPYVAVSYYTTSLVLGIGELVELAEQMEKAANTVEVLVEMDSQVGGACSVKAFKGAAASSALSVN